MDAFEQKTLVTKPFALTYTYYLSPGFQDNLDSSKPTLVFCHGYPDDAHMWAGAMPQMLESRNPMILVDILGLGWSSKPTDYTMYNYKQQANAIVQILDREGVPDNVIPIGHDWGSAICQRLYLYHRHRCIGLVLLSLAYQIPSDQPFDLDEANKVTARRFGYRQWEYWNFFTESDAPELMERNLSRVWEVNHGTYPSNVPEENGRDIWMREMFCTIGAMREYVARLGKYANHTVDLKPYAKDPALKKRFIERMGRDGFAGPVCYYHTLKENGNLEDEKALCRHPEDRKITVPLLYIGATGDWVCRTDLMSDAKEAGLVLNLEERVIEAGHWCLYEKPEEIAKMIGDWLSRKYSVK